MESIWTSDKFKAALEQLPDSEFPFTGYCCPIIKNLNPTKYSQWCMEMMRGRKDDPAARLAGKCTVEFVL